MIDFTSIFLKYPGKWVALKQDEKTVVSASKDAQKVYRAAILKGEKKPILMKIPSDSTYYIGGI